MLYKWPHLLYFTTYTHVRYKDNPLICTSRVWSCSKWSYFNVNQLHWQASAIKTWSGYKNTAICPQLQSVSVFPLYISNAWNWTRDMQLRQWQVGTLYQWAQSNPSPATIWWHLIGMCHPVHGGVVYTDTLISLDMQKVVWGWVTMGHFTFGLDFRWDQTAQLWSQSRVQIIQSLWHTPLLSP